MTATEGALLAMKEMGRVIVGTPIGAARPLPAGYILFSFAGRPLVKHRLRIMGKATRKDWDAQVQLFGLTDSNEHIRGEKFYTAELVEPE